MSTHLHRESVRLRCARSVEPGRAMRCAGCSGGGADTCRKPGHGRRHACDVQRPAAGDARTCRRSRSTSGTTSRPTTAAASVTAAGGQAPKFVRQRRHQPRVCRSEHRRQPELAERLAHGHEGRRRPQLLAREQRRLRRHPDDLDLGLGRRDRCGRRRRRARGATDQGRRVRASRSRTTPSLLLDHRCIRCSSSIARGATRRLRPRRSRRSSRRTISPRRTPRCAQDQSRPARRSRASCCACATSSTTAGATAPANANTMQARDPGVRGRRAARRGRSVAGALEGAHALRRHGRERRQPLRRRTSIALYEFKTGTRHDRLRHERRRARDEPARCRATSRGSAAGASTSRGGKAQGSTTASKKLHDLIKAHGRILDRSVGRARQRRAGRRAHRQLLRRHVGAQLHARPDAVQLRLLEPLDVEPTRTASRGSSTSADDEDLQATLQHVVATYDPVNGRRIYVNGVFTDDADPVGRRHAHRLGRHVRLRARQRGLGQPPVRGRVPPRRGPQPRADAGADPAELPGRRRREVLSCCSTSATWSTCRRLHRVRGEPVRQLRLPVQQADLHQPRSARAKPGEHPDRGHPHRRERRGGARRPGVPHSRHRRSPIRSYTPDRPAAVDARHGDRAREGSRRSTSSS